MAHFKDLLASGQALKADLELINTLRDVASAWWAKVTEASDLPSLETLVDLVASDVNSKPVKDAFGKIGAEGLRAKLSDGLKKVLDEEGRIPGKYKLLLRKVATFDETEAAQDVGLVRWGVIDKGLPIPVGDGYNLSVNAQARVELEAGDTWRYAGDAMPDPLLRVGANGMLGANGDGKLPFQLGELGAKVSASAGVGLDYYFDMRSSQALYVAAVAERLVRLPVPFGFEAVWDAFATTDLAGIVYTFEGATAAEVVVSLADTLSFGAGVVGALAAGVKIGVNLNGSYSLSFRAGPPASGGGRQLLTTLSRRRAASGSIGLSAGLDIDITALANRVHEILQRAVDVWDGALADIRPFLSPGTWLQQKASGLIGEAAGEMIKNAPLRGAIVRDLRGAIGVDTTDKSALAAWLETEISSAVERSGVLAKAEGEAGRIVDQLAARLPAFAEDQFRTALLGSLAKLPPKLEEAFKAEVEKLIGPGTTKIKKFGTALKDTGAVAQKTFDKLDDALKGARELVDKYDSLFRKVLEQTQDAARRKVAARIQIDEARTSEATYVVVGALTERTAAAAEVFKALTRGDLRRLAPLFDGSPSPGFSLDQQRSSIRRFSKSEGKFGYEVVLLGFGATGTDLLTAEASAFADGAGNVQIDTAGKLTERFTGPREGREISFVDTYGVRLLRTLEGQPKSARRTLEVGVSLSHKDESLKRGEVEGFIGSLEQAGLLPKGTTERGRSQFDLWRIDGANKRLAADITAKLWLTGEAPITLMRLAERQAGELTKDARHRIAAAGLRSLIKTGDLAAQDLANAIRIVRDFVGTRTKDLSDEAIVLSFEKLWGVGEPFTGSTAQLMRLLSAQERMQTALVEVIDGMGDIYEATPANPAKPAEDPPNTWDEKDYRKAQAHIAGSSRSWLKLNQKFLFWADKEAHPRTIALLCAMVELADADPTTAMTLVMTHRPDDGPPQTVALA